MHLMVMKKYGVIRDVTNNIVLWRRKKDIKQRWTMAVTVSLFPHTLLNNLQVFKRPLRCFISTFSKFDTIFLM